MKYWLITLTGTDGEPQLHSFEKITNLHRFVTSHSLTRNDYAIIKGELVKSFAVNFDLLRASQKESSK